MINFEKEMLRQECKLMISMVGSLSLRFLLGVDHLLSQRFIQMNGYATRRILGLWLTAFMLPLCYSDQTYKGKNM